MRTTKITTTLLDVSQLNPSSISFAEEYSDALNWIHHHITIDDLKTEALKWMEVHGYNLTEVRRLKPYRFNSLGKTAWIVNNGGLLSDTTHLKMKRWAEGMTKVEEIEEILDENGYIVSNNAGPMFEEIADSAATKNAQLYISCYSSIDNSKARFLAGKITIKELGPEVIEIVQKYSGGKATLAKKLYAHYKQSLREALADGLTDWVKPLRTIVENLGILVSSKGNSKVANRMAKNNNNTHVASKAVKNLSYAEKDDKFGIKSVNPMSIPGSAALVVFNTKNRHCEVYIADNESGLNVQGTKIVGFDETYSVSKTLRNPEVSLNQFNRANSLKRLGIMITTNTKSKPRRVSGKLNKNCILLKVIAAVESNELIAAKAGWAPVPIETAELESA